MKRPYAKGEGLAVVAAGLALIPYATPNGAQASSLTSFVGPCVPARSAPGRPLQPGLTGVPSHGSSERQRTQCLCAMSAAIKDTASSDQVQIAGRRGLLKRRRQIGQDLTKVGLLGLRKQAPVTNEGAGQPEDPRQTAEGEPDYVSNISIDVSLDDSVMPAPISPFVVAGSVTLCILAAVALLTRIPAFMNAVGAGARSLLGSAAGAAERNNVPGVLDNIRYRWRLKVGSAQARLDRARAWWDKTFSAEEQPLPANDWSITTLQERTKVGRDCLRYRFRLPHSNSVLPLGLCQEVTLCGLDSQGTVVSASYVPISPRDNMGFFELVVRKEQQGSTVNIPPETQFARLLDLLAIGDEVAVKPGRAGLQYKGPYSPITDVVLIACGLGIVPMLQMVNELLPSKESSVNAASVIWLNEKQDDFALYSELEKAFYKYHKKLDVSCIIERDLFGHQLANNPRVTEAIPDYRIGTLVAVSGPDYFVRKVQDLLTRRGYPEEVVITL